MPTSNQDSTAICVRPIILITPRAKQRTPKYDSKPIEPLEPSEPRASLDGRFGSTRPKRSNLAPSQRAALRRPAIAHEAPYITYTIKPR